MDNLGFNPKLMKIILDQHKLGPQSLHGPDHWLRVGTIGLVLADRTAANKNIVRYFAQLHDACRTNEGVDVFHGIESAHFCKKYRHLILLSDEEFETLITAVAKHPMGGISDDATIGTCWDSDRLDLLRVGIKPDRKLLSTKEAKEDLLYDWATKLYLSRLV